MTSTRQRFVSNSKWIALSLSFLPSPRDRGVTSVKWSITSTGSWVSVGWGEISRTIHSANLELEWLWKAGAFNHHRHICDCLGAKRVEATTHFTLYWLRKQTFLISSLAASLIYNLADRMASTPALWPPPPRRVSLVEVFRLRQRAHDITVQRAIANSGFFSKQRRSKLPNRGCWMESRMSVCLHDRGPEGKDLLMQLEPETS